MMSDDKQEACQETFKVKRILWCSEPEWKSKQVIDYYADKLSLLYNSDDEHCLELNVGGRVVRMPINNPWKYI